jgi:hypothetical protein
MIGVLQSQPYCVARHRSVMSQGGPRAPGNGRLHGFNLNKGGGPRVPLAETKIFLMLVFLDLAEVSSSGRLR